MERLFSLIRAIIVANGILQISCLLGYGAAYVGWFNDMELTAHILAFLTTLTVGIALFIAVVLFLLSFIKPNKRRLSIHYFIALIVEITLPPLSLLLISWCHS